MPVFLLLFILMPILELWVLIKVGTLIGVTNTVLLVLATAVVGVLLLRQQGFATLFRARQRIDSGELPAQEILEGMILAASGALLLTPGFVTDVMGFSGLLPPLRRYFVRWLIARTQIVQTPPRNKADKGNVIEGEFWRKK